MIQHYHSRLQQAVDARNKSLRCLLRVQRTGDIPDPDVPNEYVTYWKELLITREPEPSGPGTYFFGTTTENGDVTAGLGRYQKIPNIKALPKGWKNFNKHELARIAADILTEDFTGKSRFLSVIREVMNDRNMIDRAISSLGLADQPERAHLGLRMPTLPSVDRTAKNYTEQLINMITSAHDKLRIAVNARNSAMYKLDQLQLALDSTSHPDRTNPYVTEWEKHHPHVRTTPASDPDATLGYSRSGDGPVQPPKKHSLDIDVSRSTRRRTSSGKPVKGVVNNPGSPKALMALESSPVHHGGSEHNSHLPTTQSTTFPTLPKQHNPSSPLEDIDWDAFIHKEEW
ncbi:hypothetical protein H0H93_016365 [Arthromyces matolae]|nr:hypothetical protein H0H93_016365 [Arthromyces matolae]